MKTLISILMVSLCLSAQGYVVMWKAKWTVTFTGAGTITKRSLSGYVLFDTDTSSFSQVVAEPARKNFWYNAPGYDLTDVKTKNGQRVMVVTQAKTDYDGNGIAKMDFVTAKGTETYIDIGDPTFNDWLFAKTMQFSGKTISKDAQGQSILEESTGTLIFDKRTVDANFFGRGTDGVIDDLFQSYLDSGYTQLQ